MILPYCNWNMYIFEIRIFPTFQGPSLRWKYQFQFLKSPHSRSYSYYNALRIALWAPGFQHEQKEDEMKMQLLNKLQHIVHAVLCSA